MPGTDVAHATRMLEDTNELPRRPDRRAFLAGVATGLVGLATTFQISVDAGVTGSSAARQDGFWIAVAGALITLIAAIVVSRFTHELLQAKYWSQAGARLTRATQALALVTGGLGAAAMWRSQAASYAAENLQRSRYEQLEMGAYEAVLTAVVGAGLFFAIQRACSMAPLAAQVESLFDPETESAPADTAEIIERQPQRLAAACAGAATTIAVLLGLAHGNGWAGLSAAVWAASLGTAIFIAVRPGSATERKDAQLRVLVALTTGALSLALAYVGFVVGHGRANLAARYSFERHEVGALELAISGMLAALVVFALTVGTQTPASHVNAGAARRLARSKLWRGVASVVVMHAVTWGCIFGLDMAGPPPLAIGGVAALVIFLGTRPSLRSLAGAEGEVADALGDLDRADRRSGIAWVASALVGVGTFSVLWLVASKIALGGLSIYVGMLVLSTVLALNAHRRLSAGPADGSHEDLVAAYPDCSIFDDTLQTAGHIELAQRVTLASLLLGDTTRSAYELRAGEAWCGKAQEKSGLFGRLVLGRRRALDIEVSDGAEPAMRLERPFVWWRNQATVWVGERRVGTIQQRWSFRRRYVVRDAAGHELFQLLSGYLLWWRRRFRVVRGGEAVGGLRKLKLPWYKRLFASPFTTEQDRFHLALPGDADLDARRLLVGSSLLVDVTHFPTQQKVRWGAVAVALLLLLAPTAGQNDRRSAAAWPDDYSDAMADPGPSYRSQTAWESDAQPSFDDAPPRRTFPTLAPRQRALLPPLDEEPEPDVDPIDFDDTSDAVRRIRRAPKSQRRAMLAMALESFAGDLYGKGHRLPLRTMKRTADDDRLALAVIPMVGHRLAAHGCRTHLNAAMSSSDARELASCRPDGKSLPLSARRLGRAQVWAAALALDLELQAREMETETDPLHRLTVKVLLAQR